MASYLTKHRDNFTFSENDISDATGQQTRIENVLCYERDLQTL